jgi:hypothetical protein
MGSNGRRGGAQAASSPPICPAMRRGNWVWGPSGLMLTGNPSHLNITSNIRGGGEGGMSRGWSHNTGRVFPFPPQTRPGTDDPAPLGGWCCRAAPWGP